jgi:hypothetical protein
MARPQSIGSFIALPRCARLAYVLRQQLQTFLSFLEHGKTRFQDVLKLAVFHDRNKFRFERSNDGDIVEKLILHIRLIKGCAAQFGQLLLVLICRSSQRFAEFVIVRTNIGFAQHCGRPLFQGHVILQRIACKNSNRAIGRLLCDEVSGGDVGLLGCGEKMSRLEIS